MLLYNLGYINLILYKEIYESQDVISEWDLKPTHFCLSKKKSSLCWAFLRFYGIIEVAMKVIVKGRENRSQMEFFSIEEFVPADHLLRKIDSAVDFDHIYNLTQGSVLCVN